MTGYASGTAVFEWFMLEGPDDPVSVFANGKLSEVREGGGSSTAPSAETMAELESYTDVTLSIFHHLLEAERLATPEDFPDMTYDTGCPVDYIRILKEIWLNR